MLKPVIPSKVRGYLYVFGAVATPTMAYLYDQGVVSKFWFGLWAVVSMAVFGLARVNVTPDQE